MENEDEIFPGAAEEIVANLKEKAPGPGAEILNKFVEKVEAKNPAEKILERAFKRSVTQCFTGKLIKSVIAPEETEKTLCPSRISSRRDLLLLSAGFWPTFFKTAPAVGIFGKVNVYIDVSGSMEPIIPFVYGLVDGFKEYLAPSLYIFSQRVVEITKENLTRGRVETTGGTDFDCVCEHILKNKMKKAVVITDGNATVKNELAERVKKFSMVTGVLTGENNTCSLYRFAHKVFVLPSEFLQKQLK